MFEMNEKQKALFDELKPLAQKVCVNVLSGMSNIDAYIKGGGKGATKEAQESSVSKMLSNYKAVVFLDSMKAVAVNDAIMSRDEAMTILSKNARVKISDIATFSQVRVGEDENGNDIIGTVWKMKDSDDINPDVMACIKSVTITKAGPKIELHDQQGAIKQLSTMQGWDSASKIDLSSSDGTMTPKNFNDFYSDEE